MKSKVPFFTGYMMTLIDSTVAPPNFKDFAILIFAILCTQSGKNHVGDENQDYTLFPGEKPEIRPKNINTFLALLHSHVEESSIKTVSLTEPWASVWN